jgi:hypothetical protein
MARLRFLISLRIRWVSTLGAGLRSSKAEKPTNLKVRFLQYTERSWYQSKPCDEMI